MSKSSLRQKFTALRDEAHKHAVPSVWKRMRDNLWSYPAFQDATVVMLYCSKGSEAPTQDMLQRALGEGKKVALPIAHTKERAMELSYISSLDDLVPSSFGVLEPKLSNLRMCQPEEVQFALVPGIAFDYDGFRLGWGLGFYDRFLPRLSCPTAGFCYEVQITEKLPREKHDIAVKAVITEVSARAILHGLGKQK